MTQPNETLAVSNANHAVERSIVRTSTRVLLDSSSPPTCDACDSQISDGTQYKCVTVRDRDGQLTDLVFCDDRCRSASL